MRITMVGTGYVGLVTGTCFANTGNHVTCLDVDQAKIDKLKQGISPIYEPGLDEMIRRNVKAGRLVFSIDKAQAYQSAEIIFICVGTPSDEQGRADLKYVLTAAGDIGQAMEAAPGPTGGDVAERRAKIVVIKSTVPVGTNAKVRDAIAARTKKPYRMASNPEFLKEGAAINDFNKPDRVVIGVDDKGTADRLRDLYEPFVRQGNPIFVMDIPSAEMVKYAANAMLATKISFINEIANLCESYGADIDEVRRGMCSDRRIGNQFLYPGLGYGGSCFPKDVLAVISMGQQSDTPARLLESVHHVNQQQRQAFMKKIDQHFGNQESSPARGNHESPPAPGNHESPPAPAGGTRDAGGNPTSPRGTMAGKTIAIWGIAFKPGTDDIREAPSTTLMQHLLDRGATVVAYDPVARENSQRIFQDKVRHVDDPMAALDGADALVICTDWDEFRQPDFDKMKERMKSPVLFDGRNLYRLDQMKEHGFTYHSVGRHTVQ
ncbi:MAG: nucleotide sugar dehydrogenase [Phycisphaeraceae bacterium]